MQKPRLGLDHIVVAAERLEDGVAYVEERLGVSMAPGGTHPEMGTHNRLLSLGDSYLEVIAINPDAEAPDLPRWFDLDRFQDPPRLTNWVAQTDTLQGALEVAPPGTGEPMALSRGDLTWQIAISATGTLPFDGAFPGLIDWGDTAHPTSRLPASGCHLQALTVSHPKGDAVAAALSAFATDLARCLRTGPVGFRAEVQTPAGLRVLE